MNYDELKVVWDSQKQEPVLAFDTPTLIKSVELHTQVIERYVNWFELSLIFAAFIVAVLLPLDAWLEGDRIHQFFIGAISFVAGVLACRQRKNRQKMEVQYDATTRSVIEKSLAQVKSHQKARTTSLWLFHIPITIAAGIGLTFYGETRIAWLWVAVIFVCLFSYFGTQWETRTRVLPHKQQLESLLSKLDEIDLKN